jgi:hypothetical protein
MERTSITSLAAVLPKADQEVLQHFAGWLVDNGESGRVYALGAGVMLQFQSPTHHAYRHWEVADLLALADEIVERFEPHDVVEVFTSCTAFFVYLEQTGQRLPATVGLDELVERWLDLTETILVGLDLDDDDGEQDDDYDDREEDDVEPVELPARAAPDADAVLAAVTRAPILARMVGLVDALDRGATAEEIAIHPAAEGLGLDALIEWAHAAGVIESYPAAEQTTAGAEDIDDADMDDVQASDRGRTLAERPAEALDELVEVLWDLGPSLIRWGDTPSAFGDDIDEFLDAQMPGVLAFAYVRGALEFAEAASLLDLTVGHLPELEDVLADPREKARFEAHCATTLTFALDSFALAGLLDHHDAGAANARFSLTAFGEDWCQRNLAEFGYIVPVIRPFTATAADPDEEITVALAQQLRVGPEFLLPAIETLGGDRWLRAYVPRAWRLALPEAEHVLAGIADAYPDKDIKKAARKALMQYKSAGHAWN